MDFLTHHMLCASAANLPDKEALVYDGVRLTYREVARQVRGLAHGLRELGLEHSDRIGIFLGPSVDQVIAIFAASEAGGIFVPIHHSLMPEQVSHIASDCGMKILITDESKLSTLAEVWDDLPTLELVIVTGSAHLPELPLAAHVFRELCELEGPTTWEDRAIEKDLAAILYTSGSTGQPKGVMLSHANIIAGTSIVSTYLGISQSDRTLAVLPFSFDAGLNQLLTAFQQGATLVLVKFLLAKDIVQMLLREDITGLAGVPTLWSLLANSKMLQTDEFHNLRYITNTGGAMPQAVLRKLQQSLPTTNIFLMYGLTEAFRSTYLPPEELDKRPSSMGKAIPNTEILVIDDKGQRCKPGGVGELVHHGPTVSLGYWGKPELTKRVLRPHPFAPPGVHSADMVCYSGDLVRIDEDGFLYFVGRRDNLIKCSGFRISPTEVETILCRNTCVKDAAVIGIPDPVLGQHIKAFVTLTNGRPLDTAALMTFCAANMPRHMVPKSIESLGELPKTTSGKVDYPTLRRLAGVINEQ